jgi:hypothetical protein
MRERETCGLVSNHAFFPGPCILSVRSVWSVVFFGFLPRSLLRFYQGID